MEKKSRSYPPLSPVFAPSLKTSLPKKLNQHSIDPYAPPKCSTPLLPDSEVLTEDAYSDGKYLLMKQGYQFPPICPKTGQEIDTNVVPKSTIRVIHPVRWKDRPLWLNLLRLSPLIPFLFILLDGLDIIPNSTVSGLGILVMIIISLIILVSTSNLACPRYTISVYFSKSYSKKQNARKALYGFLSISVIPIMYVGCLRNSAAFHNFGFMLGIIILIGSIIAFAIVERHFTIVKKRRGYLYTKGAHPKFLAKLPSVPLSGVKEE